MALLKNLIAVREKRYFDSIFPYFKIICLKGQQLLLSTILLCFYGSMAHILIHVRLSKWEQSRLMKMDCWT